MLNAERVAALAVWLEVLEVLEQILVEFRLFDVCHHWNREKIFECRLCVLVIIVVVKTQIALALAQGPPALTKTYWADINWSSSRV